MLVKEYRIPMPMSVDEYRIAQLYMIQKKSREESCGEGSGVEILENKPYEDGPGGTGQYTHKVYHIGKHIPSWFCSILPQAALRVEEESWNAYPYTRTRYTCPFVEKFSIDIETHYKPDTGNTGDVFNLSSAEKRQRTVDPIDIVKDYVPPHEYLVEEDPKLYQSVKTRRGPLSDEWIEEINQNPGQNPVMCAYKLCKVEFRYWGMQSKIERFIHDVGLRKVMVRAHRQAWCWQDEWYGLTIEDIRQLELETQLALARKMAQYSQGEEASGAGGPAAEANGSSSTSSSSSHHHRSPSHQSISEWRMQSIARDSDDSTDEDEFFDLSYTTAAITTTGDPNSKQGDVNTLGGAFETVMRVHYPSALGHIAIRVVPCPAVCSEAFSLVSNLSPYSYDEGCLSNSQDHIPLAALPLLATSAPQYQDAVATVIIRANQVYADFMKSVEGASFSGQVCVIGDCVGGILGFDALCSSSLSPLLGKRFHLLPPFSVPRYQRFPLGDGHSALLGKTHTHAPPHLRGHRRASEASLASQVSGMADSYTASNIATIASHWWGSKRMDFALYCPDALTAFPTVALPHLFHASYWESTDVVAFILRQVMRHENASILELDGKEVSEFTPSKPREKWIRKRTQVKIRNVTANHRVCDAVFSEDAPQLVTGRFMYGPLDMVTLTGEKVIDIHIMTQPPSGEWVFFDTQLTSSSGRISYTIPDSKRLSTGVYPVKMVARGDHTSADSYLTVLPQGTEFVVFSIDGSFAASVSIMGSDPKVRAGAVDVVRHWQDLGYLIVYVTGRPDMQKQRVVAWLSQHNFPHGIVSFCEGLVHDPLRHKGNFLKSLICEAHMKIFAAYGSTKDISVYSSIGLSPSHIYIVGRATKKMLSQCQFIPDGYASHLAQLEYNQRSRPAKSASARMVLRKGSFGLGAAGGDFLRKRNHVFRTLSSQPGGGACEMDRGTPSAVASTAQRSMSIAAGCWGRSGSTREGSSGLLSPK
uniref:Phosphatidylinositol transfer protein membrane associated 2 n=1 Tax=Gadus morhua TaxID=8049 RepID=A0A8C5FFG8_GADMO